MKNTQEIITKNLAVKCSNSVISNSSLEIENYISKCFASNPGIIQVSPALVSMEIIQVTFRNIVEVFLNNE